MGGKLVEVSGCNISVPSTTQQYVLPYGRGGGGARTEGNEWRPGVEETKTDRESKEQNMGRRSTQQQRQQQHNDGRPIVDVRGTDATRLIRVRPVGTRVDLPGYEREATQYEEPGDHGLILWPQPALANDFAEHHLRDNRADAETHEENV